MKDTSTLSISDQIDFAWKGVEKSRHPQRPYTLDYVHKVFSNVEDLRGDRAFSDDPALIAGIGEFSFEDFHTSAFFIGHQKGRKTKEKIERNFGMAKPEGYRKACRIFELADRFKKPVITFIDTPGAFPGVDAEERGQAVAIAESIKRMFEVKVPTISIVIGEGGSGGALAIGVADRVLMLENSTYSVISPESCAAILFGNAGEAKKAAWALRLNAQETFKLGLCDGIIEEPGEGAHASFADTTINMRAALAKHLRDLSSQQQELRLQRKFDKFRKIDERLLFGNNS